MVGLLQTDTLVVAIIGDPFNKFAGIDVTLGGVLEIGEFLKFIKKARSYTIRVPVIKIRIIIVSSL